MADPNARQLLQTELMTLLGAVDGITPPNVLDGWKRFLQPDSLLGAVVDTNGYVNVWFVSRKRTKQDNSETSRFVPIGHALTRTHTFEIIGYYGFMEGDVNDVTASQPSEEQFQNLVDNILVAFDPIRSADGNALYVWPMQVDDIMMESFAGILCHKAILHIDTMEWIDGINPV